MSPFKYSRLKTTRVLIGGKVVIGDSAPIIVQSMVTVDTNKIIESTEQTLRIANAGGGLVRFTAQGVKEANALKLIREELDKIGCNVPLVADIHFNPKVSMVSAQNVEKVRINPGNFIDPRAKFKHFEYTETEYQQELQRLEDTFLELINICKEYKTALRIGVNHGSLSDRIMSRYGDTPEGMVESAMEFLRISKKYDFNDIVVSIKSSNTVVMVKSYRLLVDAMAKENLLFPLHLGVTEAGEGSDGRIRSAVGIGALLNDGIGDTIRVSLTEEPEIEIPVAQKLVDYYSNREDLDYNFNFLPSEPYNFSYPIENIPFIILDKKEEFIDNIDKVYTEGSPNYIWVSAENIKNIDSTFCKDKKIVVVGNTPQEHRAMFLYLREKGINEKIIIFKEYDEDDQETFDLKSSADMGGLLIEGIGDGFWLRNKGKAKVYSTLLTIMQASRRRTSKPEYISCPACGRTMYDIQSVVKKVKERTSHLKGIKIAVMGCIVNGPGEMADADYGYIGAGRGLITLYYKAQPVEKNIPQEEALDRLISLIKEHGDWIELKK
ncbi:MAG: (E)-4-hydroxy-3-methylbut-2-enyl-diphosphate synthase [Bacteroidetes bacterium]|nr:(E)-4-hydroxy-3-methylbut-2-enyl-diphosphate synthase [Bacteroidota bacterium]